MWRQLEAKGWAIVIVWECQLKKGRLEETIGRVVDEIWDNGEALHAEREERNRSREQYLQQRRQQKEKETALKAEVQRLRGVEPSRIRL